MSQSDLCSDLVNVRQRAEELARALGSLREGLQAHQHSGGPPLNVLPCLVAFTWHTDLDPVSVEESAGEHAALAVLCDVLTLARRRPFRARGFAGPCALRALSTVLDDCSDVVQALGVERFSQAVRAAVPQGMTPTALEVEGALAWWTCRHRQAWKPPDWLTDAPVRPLVEAFVQGNLLEAVPDVLSLQGACEMLGELLCRYDKEVFLAELGWECLAALKATVKERRKGPPSKPTAPTREYCLVRPNVIRWEGQTPVEQRLWHLLGALLDHGDQNIPFDYLEEVLYPGKEPKSRRLTNDVSALGRALLTIKFPWSYHTKSGHVLRG